MTAQTILPANSASSGGYEVANSLRFNDGSSDYLSRSNGTPTSLRKYTFSAWVKKTATGALHTLYSNGTNADNYMYIHFNNSTEQLEYVDVKSGAYQVNLKTTRVFRDPSAWYHIMIAVDTTQGTNTNRVKFYINGVQETSFVETTYPDQNDDLILNGSNTNIGRYVIESSRYYDGYMSEVVFVDGTQQANTDLGEFDSDSGIWKPIDVSGLTFGDNGYYLEFKQVGTSQNSSGMGADTSGEDNHFAVNNLTAVDQSTDTCTNNFATLASGLYTSGATFSQGNLQYQAPGSNPVFGSLTTIGVDNGKWYAEVKYTAGSSHYLVLGIADEVFATLSNLGSNTNTDLGKVGASLSTQAFAQNSTVAYVVNTGKVRNNNANGDYGSGGGDGDIIQIALDRDNRKVYFGINGTYEASGDPGAGSNGFDLSSLVTGDTYFIGVTNDTGASETIAEFNFGSPSYAISSSNADANGHGNFEFAVPSGFFALCTKNLAEHG
jgi:hypothetical protein